MAYNPETLSFDLPDTDQIYVSGLPSGAGERDLEEYFGSIGVIKTDKKKGGKKIHMYRDKATGALKGDATITYEDPFSAGSAVQWFNGKEWKGARRSCPRARARAHWGWAERASCSGQGFRLGGCPGRLRAPAPPSSTGRASAAIRMRAQLMERP
ncbi:MAG: hypothetical protein J3K34DRAFT_185054 [Monoraphidium minutum]|nr:MAG: hypothetical protein J3K34DRAFT_185054 [Monoraphidium minutum]